MPIKYTHLFECRNIYAIVKWFISISVLWMHDSIQSKITSMDSNRVNDFDIDIDDCDGRLQVCFIYIFCTLVI